MKILLDTNIGGNIDDALVFAYLLKQPRCELLGITTVGGELKNVHWFHLSRLWGRV
jgi:purine nucleosidase